MPALRVACVQWRLEIGMYRDPDRVVLHADKLLRQATKEGDPDLPLLVAFPEDIGTPFLFYGAPESVWTSASLEGAMKGLILAHPVRTLWARLWRASWTEALGSVLGAGAERVYVDVFSEIARKRRAYVAAGSILLPGSDGGVYNVSYVFGPSGEVLGRQEKVHLIDLEGPEGIGLSPGELDSLTVIPIPGATLGVAICYDGFFDDVLGRLSALGADLLVQPSANPGPWHLEQQVDWLRGSLAAVQSKRLFRAAVNPMMVGSLFDLEFEGQSAVFARDRTGKGGYEALGRLPGCLAAVSKNKEGVVVVEV